MKKILLQPYHIEKQLRSLVDSDDILEGMVDQLSHYSEIKVSSKSTSLYLHANPLPLDLLKIQYDFDYLLEGGVKKTGEKKVISTRIISTSDETVLFSKKIELEEIGFQAVIAQTIKEVYQALIIDLQPQKKEQEKIKNSSKSYYLEGLHHWNKYTFEELSLAISYFKKAISLDDGFAEAYAALADCYCVIGVMGFEESNKALQSADFFVKKALKLNNKRSESFVSAALVDIYLRRNYSQAKINLSQAILLKKNNLNAHHVFAMFYIHTNNLALADKHAHHNLRRSPDKIPYYDMMVKVLLYQKKFEKGLALVEKALSINRESIELKELEGHLHMHLGNNAKAIECYQLCLATSPNNPLYYSNLAYVLSKSNYYLDSNKAVNEMQKIKVDKKNMGIFHYAQGIIKLGQLDYSGFFRQINIALENRLGMFIGELIANPIYNEIRKDKRYTDLLKKLRLDNVQASKTKKRLPSSRLTLHTLTTEVFNIDPQHIAFVKSQGNYSKIFWFEDDILKNKLIRSILGSLTEQLKEVDYIVRCHKSYLINLNEELTISGNSKGYFFSSNYFPVRIPLSRAKADEIVEKYKALRAEA